MRRLLVICVLLLLLRSSAIGFVVVGGGGGGPSTNPPLINCGSFAHQTTNCGVLFPNSDSGTLSAFLLSGASNGAIPGMQGTQVNMIPGGGVHNAVILNFQPATLPVQKFTAQMVFVLNGWNISFVLNNSTNQPGNIGANFAGGAGCEGGFFQGFSVATPPDNVFALEIDQNQPLNEGTVPTYTWGSVQIYQSNVGGWPNPYVQCPCVPMSQCGTNNTPAALAKISTSPLALNSPGNNQGVTTGDTYSMSLGYDGTTLNMALADLTVGGSFSQSWIVNIPTSVGGNKAWVGVGGSTNASVPTPLLLNSFTYSVPSPL